MSENTEKPDKPHDLETSEANEIPEANETPEATAPDGDQQPTTAQPVTSPATPRFRDRLFGVRGLAAVALASLILGGAGGAAIGAAASGDDRDHDRGRPGMNDGQFPGGPGQFGGRGQDDDRQLLPPGSSQVPPTTEPEGDES